MLRILVAGLGDSDRELTAIAHALRDAGHEVVYAGPGQTPERVVEAALQEDAGLIGLAGGDRAELARVLELLADRDAEDIAVLGPDASAAEIAVWAAERPTAD